MLKYDNVCDWTYYEIRMVTFGVGDVVTEQKSPHRDKVGVGGWVRKHKSFTQHTDNQFQCDMFCFLSVTVQNC